jgi:hypothetical protein
MQRGLSDSVQVFYPRFDREVIAETIKKKLGIIDKELALLLVVLFGSYAKGDYTVASDVDLLVVYQGKVREDAYAIVKRFIDLPRLEPHVYSKEEYSRMKSTIDKMIEKGLVLFQSE